ncbi:MAG: ATP synthase F1 subunit gamma [Coprobacillus sp.]|nr:ATP synthase F1 subunit gamma [Coprobacillus sp.]
MAEQLTSIKARIRSVSGALKITKAMKLVSSVKVTRWKNKMLSNRDYIDELEKISAALLSSCTSVDTPYMQKNEEASGTLYLLVTSSLGLCGSYNTNLFRYTDETVTDDDAVIIIGTKGLAHYTRAPFHVIDDFRDYTSVDNSEMVEKLSHYLIDAFTNKQYKEIKIIYTHFKNSITFNPTTFTLLPLEREESNQPDVSDIIFEPDKNKLVEQLIPTYLMSVINTRLLEAELSENASRTQAMDNATQNAQDILDELSLDYNKARQQKITEEITEIVAASSDR